MVLIDGNNMLYRYMKTPEYWEMQYLGVRTGGPFGFVGALQKVVQRTAKDSKIICVFDGGRSERRKAYYKDYKENRTPKTIEDEMFKKQFMMEFNSQKDIICDEMLPNLGIIYIREQNYEADDIIYKICELHHKNEEILVISEDNDMLQLINLDNVKIMQPIKNHVVDRNNFKEIIGVEYKSYLIYKAILGDKSDNITKGKGAGKKTAEKLVNMLDQSRPYESLVEVTKRFHDEDVAKYAGKNVQKFRRESSVYLGLGYIARNLELMDLSREQFLNLDTNNIKTKIDSFVPQIDSEKIKFVCMKYGFQSILNNFDFWFYPFRR